MIENNQAIETTELHQRILESITSSYASLLSNDMNNIMKTLTLFGLLTLPTLVFSFFGMNVPLPIDDHSYVSWIIVVGISLILVAIVSIFLWKNKIITTNTLSYRLALNLTKGIIICLKLCQNFKSLL